MKIDIRGKVEAVPQEPSKSTSAAPLRLKDGESVKGRFLIPSPTGYDWDVRAYHQYDKFKKVACLRDTDDNNWDNCPFCKKAGQLYRNDQRDDAKAFYQKLSVYIPFEKDNGEVVFWERTVNFLTEQILPMLLDTDVCTGTQVYNTKFKITRKGSGFNDTTYIIAPIGTDDKKMPIFDLPTPTTYIAKRTAEEMTDFLNTGIMATRERVDESSTNIDVKEENKVKPYGELDTTTIENWEEISEILDSPEDLPF